ncbi:ACP phosphodiesterase [Pseudoduganella sp. DS3]|uniref:ACP phosphodiesterase n=1 Tax=Pseudoduganella guangdongensis TaxID=2692179 RepID=A0A6N9HCG0_9BURK|nr:NAD(P)H-dependent oxidoreductase [Pseudoduganella guangdongensis]MYN00545.1 ACP phosphodiesterase [Pseudoduganella guangdongensis]
MTKKIALIVGSLRKDSLNRKFANALVEVAPAELQFEFVDIGDLPLYNQDLDDAGTPPAAWTAFRDKLRNVDGIAIATPEYNRSMPGALKNAIDVGSRPWGKSIWAAKPVGVISASVGAVGGFAGNHNVRQTMVTLNAPVMPGPEVYIGSGAALIGEDGKVNNEKTKEVLAGWAQAFAKWVEANGHKG